jgi:hypothetical protein
MIYCPHCNRIIMDATQDGGYKLRSRMIIFKDGKATALCPTCKTSVEVPIQLGSVNEEVQPKPKLIVKS